jgi:ADP-heptose:LPS heptosyltransferase
MKSIAIPFNHNLQYDLGDILREWLQIGGWACLFKKLSLNNKVHLLLSSHNDNAIEFFKYVPFLTSHYIKWKNKTPDYRTISIRNRWQFIEEEEKDKLKANINKRDKNKVYLSKEEKQLHKKIKNNPYVFIHPFAGEPWRAVVPTEDYKKLIDQIITKTKYNVVVVGSSYLRNNRMASVPAINKTEIFNYQKKGLFNLVNKTSTRLATQLVLDSECFLGCWSAFLCASWEGKIPSISFMRRQTTINMPKNKMFTKRWHSDCHAINATDYSSEECFEQAIDILKNKYNG